MDQTDLWENSGEISKRTKNAVAVNDCKREEREIALLCHPYAHNNELEFGVSSRKLEELATHTCC